MAIHLRGKGISYVLWDGTLGEPSKIERPSQSPHHGRRDKPHAQHASRGARVCMHQGHAWQRGRGELSDHALHERSIVWPRAAVPPVSRALPLGRRSYTTTATPTRHTWSTFACVLGDDSHAHVHCILLLGARCRLEKILLPSDHTQRKTKVRSSNILAVAQRIHGPRTCLMPCSLFMMWSVCAAVYAECYRCVIRTVSFGRLLLMFGFWPACVSIHAPNAASAKAVHACMSLAFMHARVLADCVHHRPRVLGCGYFGGPHRCGHECRAPQLFSRRP